MKIIVRIVIALLALIVIGIVVSFMYIDSIAKAAIQRGATDALGVKTTLASADIGVLGGTFAMSGLRVDNVEGFTSDPFLTLEDGSVAVSLASLRSDTIEMPHLRLSGIDLAIDRRQGKSNYGTILENVKGDREADDSTPSGDDGPSLVIREVTIRNVTVRASFAPLGGEPTRVTIPIEEIALTDVGGNKPMPVSEVAGVIVQALLSAVVEEGGSLLPGDLAGDLGGALSQLGDLSELGVGVTTELGDKAKELLEGVGDLGEEAGKAVEDVGKQLEGIGRDLFPGKEKEEEGGG